MEGTFVPRAAALLVIAAMLLPHPSFAAVAGPEVRAPADGALPVPASTTKELGAKRAWQELRIDPPMVQRPGADPLYLGLPTRRVRGPDYDDLVEELISALQDK